MKSNQKILVRNDQQRFITLWLEPWGEDYGMSQDETLEVIAVEAEDAFYFHIDCVEKGVAVWANGDAKYVAVFKDGDMLDCGYNRRESEW